MTIVETEQAKMPVETEAEAVKATKALAEKAGLMLGELVATELNLNLSEAVKRELGETALKGHKRHSVKTRTRRKPEPTIPDYHGLDGEWAFYLQVAQAYERKVPTQDRDDIRHDIMIELDRAQKRDGKPLPLLRAYRIASLMVALFWRKLNRFSTRVCIFNGYPVEPLCRGCQRKSEGKGCVWLAVRPVASLDSEIIDPDGYATKLLDTVASDSAIDMPERWFDINELKNALPLRLVEIAYKKLDGKPLTGAERKYLCKALKQAQKKLF